MSGSEQEVSDRTNRYILEHWIAPRISPGLIEEHRREPFGSHSTDLDIVLNFLRRESDSRKPLYVLVADGHGGYRAGIVGKRRGEPIAHPDELRFETEEEAEHHVVLLQLKDLGLLERGLDEDEDS